jgi:hypothetical protein
MTRRVPSALARVSPPARRSEGVVIFLEIAALDFAASGFAGAQHS